MAAHGVTATFRAMRRFRHELFKHRRSLIGSVVLSLGYSAVTLAEPWPLKFIFDSVLIGKPLATGIGWVDRTLGGDRYLLLACATGAMVAFALLQGVLYYQLKVVTTRVGQQVALSLRRQLFAHLQRLSLSFHTERKTGELLTRLTGDVNMLRELLVASLLSFVAEGIVVVGFLTIMALLNWRLALVGIVTMPVIFLLVSVYSRRIRTATRKQRRREGEIASRLNEALSGIHLVQLFAREDDEDERLRSLNRKSFTTGMVSARLEAKLNRSVQVSVSVGTAAALWFGATEVIAGRLTPGELIVFMAYLQSFYRPIRRISRVTQRASKGSVSFDRVTSLLDKESDLADGPRVAPRFRGQISFEGVIFSYTPETSVLRGIDLVVQPGQTVALVGPTGAGKSTLLGLVPRLYDPAWGRVSIDGFDVRDFTLKSLREQISVVPQDPMLFSGSARENIAYGKPDASDAEIEAAARAALIHDFIESLPDGYESEIGERGVTLSGGQRQRVAIARALVKNAPIVLLDEPAASLDAESERLVMQALERLLEGRTAIVVAHRLITVRRADLIVVMERGRVAERGTHTQLTELGGLYRTLYEAHLVPDELSRRETLLRRLGLAERQ